MAPDTISGSLKAAMAHLMASSGRHTVSTRDNEPHPPDSVTLSLRLVIGISISIAVVIAAGFLFALYLWLRRRRRLRNRQRALQSYDGKVTVPCTKEADLCDTAISSHKLQKRKSMRQSWPLKNIAATPPRLVSDADDHGREQSSNTLEQTQLDTASRPQKLRQDSIHHLSPRRLRQPPRLVLSVPDSCSATGTIAGVNNIVESENVAVAVGSPVSRQPAARMSSTGSPISDFLHSIEKKLQDRPHAGNTHRNRSGTHLSQGFSKGISSDSGTPTKTIMTSGIPLGSTTTDLSNSQPSAPSPMWTKPAISQNSRDGVKEQPDLTSHNILSTSSCKPYTRAGPSSTAISSSLSFSKGHNIDKAHEGITTSATAPNMSLSEPVKPWSPNLPSDPFITLPATKNGKQTPTRRLSRSRSVSLERRDIRLLRQLLGGASYEDPPSISHQHSINCPPSCTFHPSPTLGNNAHSSMQQTISQKCSQSSLSLENEWLHIFDQLADPIPESLDPHHVQTPQGPKSNSCLVITSPRDMSSSCTTTAGMPAITTRQRQADSEPNQTRVRTLSVPPMQSNTHQSYVLNTEVVDRGQASTVPSVPDLAGRMTWIEHGLPSPPPKSSMRSPTRTPRICNTLSPVPSHDAKDKLTEMASEVPPAAMPHLTGAGGPLLPIAPDPIEKSTPQPSEDLGTSPLSLANTIQELRRMTSAISSSSSSSSATDGAVTPTLPVLCQDRFNPIHKRGVSGNHLSFGTPPAGIKLSDFYEAGSPTRRSGAGNRKRTTGRHDKFDPKQSTLRADDKAERRKLREKRISPSNPICLCRSCDQNRAPGATSPRRQRVIGKHISTESLGLYDSDGFPINTPIWFS